MLNSTPATSTISSVARNGFIANDDYWIIVDANCGEGERGIESNLQFMVDDEIKLEANTVLSVFK